jgi:D-alanine--poly(phosphoribitol) ligase subunit 1
MSTTAGNAGAMPGYHYNLSLLFEGIAAAHADQPALRYGEHAHSYSDLWRWVENLAALLLAEGGRQGDVIAIGHNKRPLSYALMLAALRVGVAYVNFDVASPAARTSTILNVSGASLLFYDDPAYAAELEKLAAANGCRAFFLDVHALPDVSADGRSEQVRRAAMVDGATIAYIMFTSGSTGIPKGVAVTHQNILHFIEWGRARFAISREDNFANLSPMYFDNSVFDFYIALFSGASLTPVSRELMIRPYDLVGYVGKMKCTVWFSVPSLLIYLVTMKAITPDALPTLRTIIFGGEGYPKVELKKLYDRFSPQADLVNVYGPTECTCICSAHTLTDDDFRDLSGLPTLGHLNQNFDYRILDGDDRDASTGELCLIGPNVAAGYFNDPERTASSFHLLSDPNRFMKRMYRTGDLVREEGGSLYFIARKDNQIKHMGYRIELEEIEHALVKLAQVNQAAVVYQRSNAAYGKLIGFVSCTAEVDERTLLRELATLLPDYMVPSKLILMPVLPTNPNGKVDRPKLQAMLEQ